MVSKIKRFLYFPVASYFKFFSSIQLKIWKPRIFVITGSSGKTTLLHLIESQVGERGHYSHKANSSFGIPFDILGLHRKNLTIDEWIYLFLLAPIKAFKKPFSQKLYFVEADCDRPFEGKFLGDLLKPEVTIWLNVSNTHSMNFKNLEAIAYEFGHFINYTTRLVIINSDLELISNQLKRAEANILKVSQKSLQEYKVSKTLTEFIINDKAIKFPYLLPKETFYSLKSCLLLLEYLKIETDLTFKNFQLPPGRSSLFEGIKNSTIIDSSYNANLSSMTAVLNMFNKIPGQKKWAILSDMTELGTFEKEEHQKLAEVILNCDLDQIILMGPRMAGYVYPILKERVNSKVTLEKFLTPKEVLDYLKQQISRGELLLFKGARFLEGVIEHLLVNRSDVNKLCRREEIWQRRRKQWGL